MAWRQRAVRLEAAAGPLALRPVPVQRKQVAWRVIGRGWQQGLSRASETPASTCLGGL